LQRLADRKDLEKERELLGVRAEYQAKLEKKNEDSVEKFKELYEQIDKLREWEKPS
jgi:colicin import membrane protein